MPLNSAGNFGGPRYAWGDVPGGSQRTQWNSGQNRGRFTASPEAGLHRGEWQWRGHGPSAQRSYGWDYQGGVGRDEITQHSEARMGGLFQARMAQERSGGLPQGRYAVDYERLGERAGRGGEVGYDWGWEGHHGSHNASGPGTYGSGYRASSGGGFIGSGHRASSGGYARDFRGGYGRDFGQDRGGRFAGGRGGYDRGFGGGMRGGARGGYGGDYSQPLSDAEFYRRVDRW